MCIYEYGSQEIQDHPNYVYQSFEELMQNSDVAKLTSDKEKRGSKITGTIVAEVFRKNIEYVLKKNHMTNQYKISENNVYVKAVTLNLTF